MTLSIKFKNKFKRDLNRQKKRGKKMTKISEVLRLLADGLELPAKFNNHRLIGNFKGRWECHIEPDWLLVYYLSESELILERTGTHSDLFK